MPNLVFLTRNSLQILSKTQTGVFPISTIGAFPIDFCLNTQAILAGFFVNALTAGESLFQRFFQIHRKMPSSEFIVICITVYYFA